ncbi:hypothetical protein [Moorena producens]|uniref:hypothetical protein n=1 Tax=Moorena producens TaxID=1155739 RepID=UPI0013145A39|nr:hypothetical protein [Moorena producens]
MVVYSEDLLQSSKTIASLPTPDSLIPTPDSRLPTPDSRLPIICAKTNEQAFPTVASILGSHG